MKTSLVTWFLLATLIPAGAAGAPKAPPAPADPYLWLEDVTGARPLEWVGQQNEQSKKALAESPEFKALNERFLTIVNSTARIPMATKIGDRYYNFWRDAQHPRGIWRRTTLEEYRKSEPAWETVIDLDAIGKAEGVNWVWAGAQPLPPEERYCLVSLSRGGGDANVVREFDLASGAFVEGGFTLPESKSDISWIDHDRVYVGFAFDSTTMTTSGYARIVKEWRRGTPLSAAVTVYEGKDTDVGVGAYHDFTPGFERDFAYRGITTWTNELFLRRDGKLVKIEKPEDAESRTFREWLLLTLRTDWTVGGTTYPAGALIATRLDDFLAGQRSFQVLFRPSERISLAGFSSTRSALILEELDNVRSRLYVLRPDGAAWSRTPVTGLPEFSNLNASAVDAYESDDYWLTITDFLTPTTLSLASIGGGAPEKLKETPAFFDASKDEVAQHEAVSKDGTKIPYFEVGPRDPAARRNAPTLMTGYGGFEIPELPAYNALQGAGWLERGGILVVANIRGGGEFGPKWHQGGVKEQRHHCYEDFIAVAEDLVKRGVTTPRRLGCTGGSNGGLLVGNMEVMRPDLFGAIVCHAPLLDMRRYHRMLAGASWMGEYGDPDDPKQWAFIKGWSPYQMVKKGVKYAPILFTSSTRDDRVHPGHARKMVARMEELGADVLYYENIEGGHGGSATNEQRAFMSALGYTFLWQRIGGLEKVGTDVR